MIGVIVICLAMIFILYITLGRAVSDFNAQLRAEEEAKRTFKLVSAGSVEKNFSTAFVDINKKFLPPDDANSNKNAIMVVDGDSMERFGIKDGEIVFVDTEDISLSRDTNIFFVLKINKWGNAHKIEYKLRKVIDFYDCIYENREAFDIWVKNHPELNADELYEKYEKEYAKIGECKRLGCRLLISETTKDGKPYYSFHPESYIYGKVKNIIPKETVKIIEKK